MDSWSVKQLKYMSNGGNKALKEFLQPYDIPEEPPMTKYTTKACKYYREMLKSKVDDIELSTQPPEPAEGAEVEEIEPQV